MQISDFLVDKYKTFLNVKNIKLFKTQLSHIKSDKHFQDLCPKMKSVSFTAVYPDVV